MNNNLKILCALTAVSIFLLVIIGCSPDDTETSDTSQTKAPEPTKIQTLGTVDLYAKNWDADPEVDGLEFNLEPKDKDNDLVKTDGTVSVRLYKLASLTRNCLKRDEDLLDSWTDVQVKKADFSYITGVKVQLTYDNYVPTSDSTDAGCAEITFTTPDGQSFKAVDEYISVNYGY